MRSRLFWLRGLFVLLFLAVTYLTLTPNPDDTKTGFEAARLIASLLFGDPQLGDKVAHFMAYNALGASAFWAELFLFSKKRWTPAILAVYGIALEGVQGLGGVRTAELADAVANGLGAISGFAGAIILAMLVARVRPV